MGTADIATAADELVRQGFRVGDWEVHPLQGVIAQAGHRMHVEPKVMDVLVCLARHPGEVVTRDMLLAEVWKGLVVTDDVVTRCISELRTVLRDTGRDRRFIRTIPKRGYSLLVPVEPLAAEEPPAEPAAPVPPSAAALPVRTVMDGAARVARRAASTTRTLVRNALLGIGLLIVLLVALIWLLSGDDGVKVIIDPADGDEPAATRAPAIRSVAVLPLVNLSGNPEHDYFSDGLAEDIRNALMGVGDLRVAARTSSMAFRDRPMDVREIARQLDVQALLEGTVRIDGNQLRVTAQLTDGQTGYPVWASAFERPVTGKLALQAEVAAALIAQLAPSLANGGQLAAAATTTGSEEAHDAYLLGRYYWNQRTRAGLERSVGYFGQALALDPDYALAYSGLADAWSVLLDNGYRSREEAVPKAREYAEKALALAPDLAEAHASMGMVHKQEGELAKARADYQRAVELEPGYSMGQMWLGILWLGMGDANQAARHLTTALELDPLHPSVQANYLAALLARGELDRAREEARRLMAISPGAKLQHMLAEVGLELGQYDEVLAGAVAQAAPRESGPYPHEAAIEALIYLQRFDEAARLIRDNGPAMAAKQRHALEASLAVAKRDPATLRRAAAGLVSPATLASVTLAYQGCIRQRAELWLGIADFLERQPAAAGRFRSVAASAQPVICEEEAPALRAVALAYGLATAAELGGPDFGQAVAAARKDLEGWRQLGWNDASFAMAGIAIAVLAGDEAGATGLLQDVRRRGLQPYGRLLASPLFDGLWERPPLAGERAALAAEYAATRARATQVTLAKLGL